MKQIVAALTLKLKLACVLFVGTPSKLLSSCCSCSLDSRSLLDVIFREPRERNEVAIASFERFKSNKKRGESRYLRFLSAYSGNDAITNAGS